MEKIKNRDLKINGSGKVAGGVFENVEISGSGKIDGDIECLRFKTSGSSKIRGNVTSSTLFKVSGSSHIYGHVDASSIDVSGSTHIEGHVGTKSLNVSGSTHIERHLAAEVIEVNGGITVDENCSADEFNVSGSFDVNGLLSADKINVKLYHNSRAREIGGETITIKIGPKGFGLGKLLGSLFNHELIVDLVEGDEIYLENTVAKVVRGNRVRIGTGCKIDRVEYKEQFEVINNGEVKAEQKIK